MPLSFIEIDTSIPNGEYYAKGQFSYKDKLVYCIELYFTIVNN